ncbi:hypothetical protein F0L74_09985 [Chitinophaga agrisoli]|uniref:Uncharacterized protein n=1 Tax=Chitinophaga agrisoli TaxID=2607653 RepID=A0A5B2VW73_9BACT|nr:hypothetical protein F0L74_09985 [Chitinophaga agrisoli]
MSNVIGLSAYHEENLRKLAAHLLPGNLETDFDMAFYTSYSRSIEDSAIDCGTAGCAKGHGPSAGIPKFHYETWNDYGLRVFGMKVKTLEWEWVFSGDWYSTDNTPEGAAKRILHLLESGVPDNWCNQLNGYAPLCYL